MDNEILGEGADVVVPVSLPLNQPSIQEFAHARRPPRFRPVNMSGLPSSLSTLRPASLPLPSAMPARAPTSPQPADERARVQSVRETLLAGIADGESKRLITSEIREEPEDGADADEAAVAVNEREAEILKLVAASMPSHRSAWKRDSSAWQTFVGRTRPADAHGGKAPEDHRDDDDTSNGDSAAYYDESEDDSEEEPRGAYGAVWRAVTMTLTLTPRETADQWSGENLSKSLPIPIGPLGSQKGGLPSIQPKASLPGDRPAPVDKVSAAALRRASYAERDRNRLLDPGALDFTAEDDDEEDDEDVAEGEDSTKSRQLALRILQKRSQLPADGAYIRSMPLDLETYGSRRFMA
ncbi:hypothetical protein EIP86_010148 [Pleurotus ostreatoroseus]|nr:hypothetical protein EIP86_010148 [Pleurotus ostreatoroseus]